MSTLIELVLQEKNDSLESFENRITAAAERMVWVSKLDPAWVEECVGTARFELGIPDDVEPNLYMMNDRIDVDFTMRSRKCEYENLIEHDEASLSWNGNYIKVVKEMEFQGVKVSLEMEAIIPDDVKDTLIACKKIQDIVSTNQTAMC